MLKELIGLALIIFLLPNISALIISEVEMNPKDDCNDCTEWAELYSEEEVNLSEYILENNKSKIINLSGIKRGYISIDFGKQFLTNKGDILILKKENVTVDEILLEDSANNDLTWQLCDEDWMFANSTKGQENNCISMEQNLSEQNNEANEEISETANSMQNPVMSSTPNVITLETIDLTPTALNIKSENDNENLGKSLALAGVVSFCIGFGALFFLRQAGRRKQNEFR